MLYHGSVHRLFSVVRSVVTGGSYRRPKRSVWRVGESFIKCNDGQTHYLDRPASDPSGAPSLALHWSLVQTFGRGQTVGSPRNFCSSIPKKGSSCTNTKRFCESLKYLLRTRKACAETGAWSSGLVDFGSIPTVVLLGKALNEIALQEDKLIHKISTEDRKCPFPNKRAKLQIFYYGEGTFSRKLMFAKVDFLL